MNKKTPSIHGNDRVLLGGGPDAAHVEAFLTFKLHNQGRSPRTVEMYGFALGRFEEFLAGKDPLAVTQDELIAYAGPWLHKHGIRPVNRRYHITALREFYKWLYRTGKLPGDLAQFVPYPHTPRSTPRALLLNSLQQIMYEPDFNTFEGLRDAAMLAVLAGCGLRVSGLIALNESNLVHDVYEGQPCIMIRVTEKGGQQRLVPVPPIADLLLRMHIEHPQMKTIERRLKDGDAVLFPTVNNRRCPPSHYSGERRRFSKRAVHDMIVKYGERAGVPKDQLHAHAFRHLYGIELAESDVDLLIRQKLMGHADPKTTSIYTNLAMRKLTKEAFRANPLAKIKSPVSDIIERLAGKNPEPQPLPAAPPRRSDRR